MPSQQSIFRQRGFTLIELLIAIGLFAVITTISYQALDTAIISRQITGEKVERLSKINYAFTLLSRDLMQAVNRPVRNNVGTTLAGIYSPTPGDQAIEFTHYGRIFSMNPIQYTLQRSRYLLEEGNLYRETWDVLDRSVDSTPRRQLLIEEVSGLSFEFHEHNKNTHDHWPYLMGGQGTDARHLPTGISVHLEVAPYGIISRKFIVRS